MKWTDELMVKMAEAIIERLGKEKKKLLLYLLLLIIANDIALVLLIKLFA